MNFFKLKNQNINLDKIINFRHEGNDLLLFDNPDIPFSFYDPDKKLYESLCLHVYGPEPRKRTARVDR